MSLAGLSIRRPVLATVFSLAIVLFGLVGFNLLGIREYPSVDPPIIDIRVNYPGANAAIVETEVTEPLEESVNGAAGIRTLSSTSRDGQARLTVEFEVGEDMEAAANEIRDRVARAGRRLPAGIDPPIVSKADADATPVVVLSLYSSTWDLTQVSEYARNRLKERIQNLPGVSEVTLWGEQRPVLRLWLDPVQMRAMQVSMSDLKQALSAENLELPAGVIEGAGQSLSLRTLGRITRPQEVERLVVRSGLNAPTVRVGDFARVRFEAKDPRQSWTRNGIPVVLMAVMPQPGSNHLEIAAGVKERVAELQKDLPPELEWTMGFDASRYIEASIFEVQETLVISFLLVIGVIFFFLREVRITLIPIFAIPVSLVGAFFGMYLMGYTINVLTLLGLVLAIGLVVDDAIVVVENIWHKIEAGQSPKSAALEGTQEIFFAIIATTLALVAVFVPIFFLSGMTGQLFKEFALVMVVAVVLSAFVALTLTPMLCSKWLKPHKPGLLVRRTEPFFAGLNQTYAWVLHRFMKRSWLLFPTMALVLAGIVWAWPHLPREMMPSEDRGLLMIRGTLPEGTTAPRTRQITAQYAADLQMQLPGTQEILAGVGGYAGNPNQSMVRILLQEPSDSAPRPAQQILADQAQALSRTYSDVRFSVSQPQALGGRGGGMPVQIVLMAPQLEELRRILPGVLAAARQNPLFTVVDADLKFTKPELHLQIDREKAQLAGLRVQDIAQVLEGALGESRLGQFNQGGKQYDLLASLSLDRADAPVDLDLLTVRNPAGVLLPLSAFVHSQEVAAPPQLPRFDRMVSATVSAGLPKGVTVGEGLVAMQKIIDSVQAANPGLRTQLTGQSRDFAESSNTLQYAFLMALVFIFLVLAGQFESFRAPWVILLTVPLAIGGAVWALACTGLTLNLFSQIAGILLIGLVTKNGILIVELANQHAKSTGVDRIQAALYASQRRFRPILMTSLCTILGAVPLILSASPSRVSMGVALLGGLVVSTLLTLLVIPAAYAWFGPKGQAQTKLAGAGVQVLSQWIWGVGLLAGGLFLGAQNVQGNELQGSLKTPKLQPSASLSLPAWIASARTGTWTLDQVWHKVQLHNPDLLLQANSLEQSAQQKKQARALLWPSVEGLVGQNYTLPDDQALRSQSLVELNAQWTLWDGGRALKNLDVLKAQQGALVEENLEQKRTLRLGVEKAYGQAQLAWMRWQLALQSSQLSQERVALVQNRYALGKVAQFEVLRAQVDEQKDRAAVLEAWRLTQTSLQDLMALWGLGSQDLEQGEMGPFGQWILASAPDPQLIWPLQAPDAQFWGQWPEQSGADTVVSGDFKPSKSNWANHPKWRALEQKRLGAEAVLQASRSAYWPQLSVKSARTWSDGQGAVGNSDLDWQGTWQLGAQLKWNFWRGGADQAVVEQARLELRAAQIRLGALESELERSERTALLAVQRALEQRTLQGARVRLAQQALTLAQAQWSLGTLSALDLRNSQEQFWTAQVQWVESAENLRFAQKAYAITLGKVD